MTLPFPRSASECAPPAAIRIAPAIACTCTGTRRFCVVPSPSCPLAFWPKDQTVPSLRSASEWSSPAAIDTTDESEATCTGAARSRVVPSPSCPWPL
jgi:hypothetical protein